LKKDTSLVPALRGWQSDSKAKSMLKKDTSFVPALRGWQRS
jgi:hypothetical protein